MRLVLTLAASLVNAAPALAEGWQVETTTDAGTGVETVTATVAGEGGARMLIACRNGLRTFMALMPGQVPLPSGNTADAAIVMDGVDPVRLPVVLIDRGAATLVAATAPTQVPALVARLREADGPIGLIVTKGGTERAKQVFAGEGAGEAFARLDADCPEK